ncbi:MAG: hypothetical protein DI570_05290 [Phenylobacterium zucineum]|nr:MAG: hypothetical protein DI570_05290 [Phenylobacterium zucineum]
MIRGVGALLGLLILTATAARAQEPAPDAIDAILRAPADDQPPEPNPPPEPRPSHGKPVFIHETGRTTDGPGTEADRAYDARLRMSASAARSFQGPLEGGWTLNAGGRDLFVLELIDRTGFVEGAWRDLRRPGALDASGLIDAADRMSGDVTLRISEAVLVLRPAASGWAGELTEAGRTEAARLTRRGP